MGGWGWGELVFLGSRGCGWIAGVADKWDRRVWLSGGQASIVTSPFFYPELEIAIRVTLYAVIFLMSVGGNALIIVVLGLSRRLRTVTNAFLLSLAVSDLLLAVACMPFTLLPNLMGTFIFGTVVCKAVAYLMGT